MDKSEMNNLYRYAISLTRDEDMAYDLLQSSIERGLKKGLESIDEPLAYLKVIIRNMFFDLKRHNKVIPFVSLEQCNEEYDQETEECSLEDLYIQQEDVERIIKTLTPTESELLYLWAVEEYTAEEISVRQNLPRGTILSRLHRLKQRIRNNLNETSPIYDRQHNE